MAKKNSEKEDFSKIDYLQTVFKVYSNWDGSMDYL